jgi:hypothetical protein
MMGLGKMNLLPVIAIERLSFLFTSMLPVAVYVSLSPIFGVIPSLRASP